MKRFLGMGSFGEVWMAQNPGYPGCRAYKFFTQAEGRSWMKTEQKNLCAIKQKLDGHPNIVQYLDVNAEAEIPFLALEYAGGGNLEDWILEGPDGERPVMRLHDAVCGLVEGTAAAHREGICHRDLKPANIVLTEHQHAPQVKITDFGIASVVDEISRESGHETMGFGTPLYQPPEASVPGVAVNGFKADVFAIGVIWYQLMTGSLERPPYDFGERISRCGADSHTVRLITRCLASPNNRYRTAEELRSEMTEMIPFRDLIPDGILDVQHVFREYLCTQ
ncbi:MAG: serine/threonine-protein kinase [Planctomycetaceae bacterium]